MPELLVLSEDEVRRLLDLDGLAAALRTALRSVSAGTASVPARIGAYSEAGLLGAMPGFVPELGLGAKLVAYLRDNHTRGLPGHQALITLFNPNDGTPCALMGGTRIAGIRTAMTAAVGAAALARPDARALAILGAGVQGGTHLEAFTHELSFADIRVASRDPSRAAELADRSSVARPVGSFERAERRSTRRRWRSPPSSWSRGRRPPARSPPARASSPGWTRTRSRRSGRCCSASIQGARRIRRSPCTSPPGMPLRIWRRPRSSTARRSPVRSAPASRSERTSHRRVEPVRSVITTTAADPASPPRVRARVRGSRVPARRVARLLVDSVPRDWHVGPGGATGTAARRRGVETVRIS